MRDPKTEIADQNSGGDVELVTAAYTIPSGWKSRIERSAKDQDLNASQVVRRILREHFDREDNGQPEAQTA